MLCTYRQRSALEFGSFLVNTDANGIYNWKIGVRQNTDAQRIHYLVAKYQHNYYARNQTIAQCLDSPIFPRL